MESAPEIVQAYVELGDVHPDVAGVYLYLRGRQGTKALWQETVEHAIIMLASPMLGVLRPHNGGAGYALTMRLETALLRLRAMTRVAAGGEEAEPIVVAFPTPSLPRSPSRPLLVLVRPTNSNHHSRPFGLVCWRD